VRILACSREWRDIEEKWKKDEEEEEKMKGLP